MQSILERLDVNQVYLSETEERKRLIHPILPTDDEYIAQWYEKYKGGQNPFRMDNPIETLRGEFVRSKSEKMIADMYYMANIPYVYEPGLALDDGRILYPDFAVLNISERKTFYHEHFGMMDDAEYCSNAIEKMRMYSTHGFWQGENMIYTFEGRDNVFNQREIKGVIQHFLKGEE